MNMKTILMLAVAFILGALFGAPIVKPLADKIGLGGMVGTNVESKKSEEDGI